MKETRHARYKRGWPSDVIVHRVFVTFGATRPYKMACKDYHMRGAEIAFTSNPVTCIFCVAKWKTK